MPEQAIFTLGEAAKATSKSKATISNAIKTGRLSVQEKTESGYRIAASELFRAFPPNGLNRHTNGSAEQILTPEPNSPNGLLQREIELLREERDRERRQFEGTIDDLRRRLDTEADERRRLTMLLTDQRQQQQPAPRPSATVEGWRRRLAGWIAGVGV